MKNPEFEGFPPDMFSFLSDLARNNNRDWFQSHKPRYREVVVEPMGQFIVAMRTRLEGISEHFNADPRPHGGSMFRIYRDARFSKDKRPYKENVGCQFRHLMGKNAHAPGFYVHLEPGQVFIGAGIWKPDSAALSRIREAIVDNPAAWKKVTSNAVFEQYFDGLCGDSLQRAPRGFSPDHPMIADLRHKSFYVMQQVDQLAACNDQFVNAVERVFRAADPLMEFISFALALPYRSRNKEEDARVGV